MKKQILIAVTAALCLSFAACGTQGADTNAKADTAGSTDASTEIGDSSRIANPWIEYSSLEEAAQAAGFEMTAPDRIEGYSEITFQVLAGDDDTEALLEIIYANESSSISIRKAAGSEDISGDYNAYAVSVTENIGENEVVMKGREEGSVSLAVWTAGDYTYAISAADEISVEECGELVREVQ